MKWDYPTPDRLNAVLAFRLTPYKHIAKPVVLVIPALFISTSINREHQ